MTPTWRIVQIKHERFEIQRLKTHRFLWWTWEQWDPVDYEHSLAKAQHTMERMIVATISFPRVIEEVSDEVAYVRARLQ
jgi:hypothetical protein